MIYKIQRAIVSTQDNPPCLVYNEDRTYVRELYFSDIESLFGDKYKIYVEAHISFVNQDFFFQVEKTIDDQDW